MPSAFTGPLSATQLDADWRPWRLEQALVYDVGRLGSGRSITVPRGFVTDGASVPRPLWVFLPPFGRYSRAAALHDLLYDLLVLGAPHPLAPTFRAAADVFWEAMGPLKVDPLSRGAMFAVVSCAAVLYDRNGAPPRRRSLPKGAPQLTP